MATPTSAGNASCIDRGEARKPKSPLSHALRRTRARRRTAGPETGDVRYDCRMTSVVREPAGAQRPSRSAVGLFAACLLLLALAAAMSVDVVRSAFKVKSDEATYVAMTLSAAFDGDLTYERHDLERFWASTSRGRRASSSSAASGSGSAAMPTPPFVRATRSCPTCGRTACTTARRWCTRWSPRRSCGSSA